MNNIKFVNEMHQEFFEQYICKCRELDVYHMSLIYCLGISQDTRKYIHSIYDFKAECIKTECLREGWITSGSARVIRLAFNLYTNGIPSDYEDYSENQLNECKLYTVEEIFCCSYAKYFWEAVKIRYPEFTL